MREQGLQGVPDSGRGSEGEQAPPRNCKRLSMASGSEVGLEIGSREG